jgi:hypothetical protein
MHLQQTSSPQACLPSSVPEAADKEDTDDGWMLMVDDFKLFLEEYALATETADTEAIEPRTLAEAKRHPDWILWEKAIYEELETLWSAGTWERVEKPQGANIVGSNWVFHIKKDATGMS